MDLWGYDVDGVSSVSILLKYFEMQIIRQTLYT